MFVIDKIKQLHLDQEEYRDMAILYRANYISRSFEDMLIKYQIPYRVYGGMSFFPQGNQRYGCLSAVVVVFGR